MSKISDRTIRVLAIESSCDETAGAVVEVVSNKDKELSKNQKLNPYSLILKSNVISSQVKLHAKYGGVYPELASREHIRNIIPVINEAIDVAQILNPNFQIPNKSQFSNLKLQNIDYIAVTSGPGLIGSLLVGVNTAKTTAYALKKPIYAINHLEGHIYSCFARGNSKHEVRNSKQIDTLCHPEAKTKDHMRFFANAQNDSGVSDFDFRISDLPEFPALALIVSGGHTSLVLMKKHFDYQIIGETLDDAVGESFDKVAKMMGLGYPGGPAIAKMAMEITNHKSQITNKSQIPNDKSQTENCKLKTENIDFHFPRPMINSKDFNFSFSGIKTSVLYTIQKLKKPLSKETKSLICKEFQDAVVETLIAKTLKAAKKYKVKSILLCGGVSANQRLQDEFKSALKCHPECNEGSRFFANAQNDKRDAQNDRENTQNDRIDNQNDKIKLFCPEKSLTGDNAAMIGIAAAYRIALGKKPTPWYDVNVDPNLQF